jgi:hypothetical protein
MCSHPRGDRWARSPGSGCGDAARDQTKKALWELDNLCRTLYTLTFIDDVGLRQSVPTDPHALPRIALQGKRRAEVRMADCSIRKGS